MTSSPIVSNNIPRIILVTDATVVTMDSQKRILSPGTIVSVDGEITAVLTNEEFNKLNSQNQFGKYPTTINDQRHHRCWDDLCYLDCRNRSIRWCSAGARHSSDSRFTPTRDRSPICSGGWVMPGRWARANQRYHHHQHIYQIPIR